MPGKTDFGWAIEQYKKVFNDPLVLKIVDTENY
jgi:hypothetical protein